MKKITQKSTMAIMLSLLMAFSVSAQKPQGKGYGQGQGMRQNQPNARIQNLIPDLTEDQITQLKALRLDHQKEMINYKNKMGELQAQRRTIMSAYAIDTKAADKLTDEKTALMNKMMKAQTAHQASLKKVLTEEQAMRYDQLRQRKGRGNKGPGKGQMARGGQGRHAQGNRPGGGRYNANM